MIQFIKPKHPTVSIVLPTYNRHDYLALAIESVLSQSFQDFELIIINDGSTDDSEQLIRAYRDSRIVYVSQENLGEYPATNRGLHMARGRYFTWIHSDDTMPDLSLQRRVDGLEEFPEITLVHGNIEKIDERGEVTEKLEAADLTAALTRIEMLKPADERAHRYPIHHTTIMFRSALLEKMGYWDETLPFAGDIDWMLRALQSARIKKVAGILYHYRTHAGTRRVLDRQHGVDVSAVLEYIAQRSEADSKQSV